MAKKELEPQRNLKTIHRLLCRFGSVHGPTLPVEKYTLHRDPLSYLRFSPLPILYAGWTRRSPFRTHHRYLRTAKPFGRRR
jgi:hypothetical protein